MLQEKYVLLTEEQKVNNGTHFPATVQQLDTYEIIKEICWYSNYIEMRFIRRSSLLLLVSLKQGQR
jgi:hypothetical protein